MQKTLILVSMLVLGWTQTLQGIPVLPEPLYPTQENFDQTLFMGTWYDVAVATTCPHMQSHRGEAAVGKMVFESSTTEGKFKATRTSLRHGTCREHSLDYELTTTPGRFSYYLEKWGTDVDAYVVHTNYIEYAMVIRSKQKSSGDKSTSLKLYSRTTTVRDTVMDDFKTLVRQQGMSDDTVIIKKDKGSLFAASSIQTLDKSKSTIRKLETMKEYTHWATMMSGECVPGEPVAESTAQPEPQRVKRNVVSSLVAADAEGSGDGASFFNDTEACDAEPDTGPCFGLHQRYFYNSSSMSCELFKFGGCLGNQNNFVTERECLQRCRTEAVCRLPMAAQPCTGQPPIWAFDSTAGLCVPYKGGFCQANANKFYSKAECEEYCGVVKDDAELLKTN